MTDGRELRVLIYNADSESAPAHEERVFLPADAQFQDFIEALKAESPDAYEVVRRRVMRAAGRVLAYGKDDPLLIAIDEKLAQGGTLVFPAEEGDAPVGATALAPPGAPRPGEPSNSQAGRCASLRAERCAARPGCPSPQQTRSRANGPRRRRRHRSRAAPSPSLLARGSACRRT